MIDNPKTPTDLILNIIDCSLTKDYALYVISIKQPTLYDDAVKNWNIYYKLYLDSKKN